MFRLPDISLVHESHNIPFSDPWSGLTEPVKSRIENTRLESFKNREGVWCNILQHTNLIGSIVEQGDKI